MTTLVAIQGNGWAAVGCDSRSSGDDGRFMELATHKIIENNRNSYSTIQHVYTIGEVVSTK